MQAAGREGESEDEQVKHCNMSNHLELCDCNVKLYQMFYADKLEG